MEMMMASNYYKYGITPAELKEVRKYIIQDIKNGHVAPNPITHMTLRKYFDMVKECMIGAADENGIVRDKFGSTWYSESKNSDVRTQDPIEVTKNWMDGRGLFTEHFNNFSIWWVKSHWGNWENIGNNDQNQWYHEDRLDDPLWFKECIGCIGHGGHPTELLTHGNFNATPIDDDGDKWVLTFGTFSRSDYYVLKSYLYLKRKGYPVFIDNDSIYLTNKQKGELNELYI